MNEEQMMTLGRRAIACNGWRWMPGMLMTELTLSSIEGITTCLEDRVLQVKDDDGLWYVQCEMFPHDDDGDHEFRWADATSIPNLTDPATLGCLLALVRQAWGRPSGTVRRWSVDGWYWHADYDDEHVSGKRLYPTEAEALVAALEAAP